MSDVYLPVLKETKDPHYRYKMPKLCAKVEGSGNGIKTVITNMTAIAKAIDRPPSYPTKYFGCELGAQVTISNDLFVVNGAHDAEKLLNLLYNFIRKFVLCTKCQNPETSLIVANQTIRQKCAACGHESMIPKQIHKLTTYIINHPPESSGSIVPVNGTSSSSSKGHKSKSDKKSKKSGSSTGGANGGQHSPTNGNADDLNGDNDGKDDDFDDFADEELTAAAYKERLREITEGLQAGMYMSDQKESANIFYQLVKEKREANQLLDANVQKELVKEAERLSIRDKATLILSELLFTENIIEEIKKYKILFLRFCNENKKAQKYLLGGFEKLVGDVYKDTLLNNTAKILKQFYDEDILEEETLIEWSSKESKKYVSKEMSKKIHEKAAPLIKWLKEAEVEEDSDEDEEETNQRTNNNSNNHVSTKAGQAGSSATAQQQKHLANSEEDDDDDIDLEFSHRVSGIRVEEVKPVVSKAVNADVAKADDEDIDIDNI